MIDSKNSVHLVTSIFIVSFELQVPDTVLFINRDFNLWFSIALFCKQISLYSLQEFKGLRQRQFMIVGLPLVTEYSHTISISFDEEIFAAV